MSSLPPGVLTIFLFSEFLMLGIGGLAEERLPSQDQTIFRKRKRLAPGSTFHTQTDQSRAHLEFSQVGPIFPALITPGPGTKATRAAPTLLRLLKLFLLANPKPDTLPYLASLQKPVEVEAHLLLFLTPDQSWCFPMWPWEVCGASHI